MPGFLPISAPTLVGGKVAGEENLSSLMCRVCTHTYGGLKSNLPTLSFLATAKSQTLSPSGSSALTDLSFLPGAPAYQLSSALCLSKTQVTLLLKSPVAPYCLQEKAQTHLGLVYLHPS